jgi:hypothetical protein
MTHRVARRGVEPGAKFVMQRLSLSFTSAFVLPLTLRRSLVPSGARANHATWVTKKLGANVPRQ